MQGQLQSTPDSHLTMNLHVRGNWGPKLHEQTRTYWGSRLHEQTRTCSMHVHASTSDKIQKSSMLQAHTSLCICISAMQTCFPMQLRCTHTRTATWGQHELIDATVKGNNPSMYTTLMETALCEQLAHITETFAVIS